MENKEVEEGVVWISCHLGESFPFFQMLLLVEGNVDGFKARGESVDVRVDVKKLVNLIQTLQEENRILQAKVSSTPTKETTKEKTSTPTVLSDKAQEKKDEYERILEKSNKGEELTPEEITSLKEIRDAKNKKRAYKPKGPIPESLKKYFE